MKNSPPGTLPHSEIYSMTESARLLHKIFNDRCNDLQVSGIQRKVIESFYAGSMSKHVFTPKRKVVPKNIQRQVRLRDLHRCRRCHRGESDGVVLCFDHIIPWMVSQDNSLENIQLLCRGCNAEKGARLPGETAEQERARVLEHNRRIMSSPEFRAHMEPVYEYVRELCKTEEHQQAFWQGMASIDREAWREETRRACWENPERNAKMAKAMKAISRVRSANAALAKAFRLENYSLTIQGQVYDRSYYRMAKSLMPRSPKPRKKRSDFGVRVRTEASKIQQGLSMKASWARRKALLSGPVNEATQ